MKTLKITLILFFIALFGCESREEKIISKWKFMEGYHFGDFLDFENQKFRIENDTVYKDSKVFAVVEELKTESLPGTENKLILKDIGSGKLATYTDKGK